MKNVLLYYSFSFSFGGGDYLPLALAAELQKVSNLTLAVDVADNIEVSSRIFGIDIDMSKVWSLETHTQGVGRATCFAKVLGSALPPARAPALMGYTVWVTTNWENSSRDGNTRTTLPPS